MPLDLVLPDLLDAAPGLRMPALERWLARGDARVLPGGSLQRLLADAYALADPAPVAPIAWAGEGATPEGPMVRADPVHLELRQDAVALHDGSALALSNEEARTLMEALQAHFAADGFAFRLAAPDRWYLRVPEGEIPAAIPLAEARGRNLFGILPQGRGRINWRSAITEAQMVLSAHPVNAARAARGLPMANSVWFWGGGTAPHALPRPYALVHASDAFARGLAILSGTRALPAPRRWDEIDAVNPHESVLVVLDGPGAAARGGDDGAAAQRAAEIDDTWFVSLTDALHRFERVTLILPRGRNSLAVRVAPNARWRLLRRARPLSTHA